MANKIIIIIVQLFRMGIIANVAIDVQLCSMLIYLPIVGGQT